MGDKQSRHVAFPDLEQRYAHIQDPNARRRLVLADIDSRPFGQSHVRAILVAGTGFLTDSYDVCPPRPASIAVANQYGDLRHQPGQCGALAFIGVLTTFLIPETKGKTLEELAGEESFDGHRKTHPSRVERLWRRLVERTTRRIGDETEMVTGTVDGASVLESARLREQGNKGPTEINVVLNSS